MAKGTSIPRRRRLASYTGKMMVDVFRGQLRIRKWPAKRGPPKSAKQAFWVDWFRQANFLAKYADPILQVRAMEMAKNSGLYPRDLHLAAMRGRLFTWVGSDGWRWYSMAARGDISESLDVLGQTIGNVLVRATDFWKPAVGDVSGDVLTAQGPGVAPLFAPVVATAGFIGGCLLHRTSAFSLPDNALTTIPFNGETFDTNNFHDNAVNPGRITMPAGVSYCQLSADIEIASNQTGFRRVLFNQNGGAVPGRATLRIPAHVHNTQDLSIVSGVVPAAPGDFFEFKAFQNSGSARNVGTQNWNLSFGCQIW